MKQKKDSIILHIVVEDTTVAMILCQMMGLEWKPYFSGFSAVNFDDPRRLNALTMVIQNFYKSKKQNHFLTINFNKCFFGNTFGEGIVDQEKDMNLVC